MFFKKRANRKSGKKQKMIVFFHCPKTAGTRIREIIRHNVSGKIYEVNQPSDLSFYSDNELNEYEVLMGHTGFGMCNRVIRPSVSVTFLRDPVERVRSIYDCWKHLDIPGEIGAVLAKQMSLDEFVKSDHPQVVATISNMMTWFYFCDFDFLTRNTYKDISEAELLKRAKENLEKISFIGLQERFIDYSTSLQTRMGWSVLEDHMVNVGPIPYEMREPISASVRDKVIEAVGLDMELYQYGKELAEKQLLLSEPFLSASNMIPKR